MTILRILISIQSIHVKNASRVPIIWKFVLGAIGDYEMNKRTAVASDVL